jgi:ketosteroid isomerase-like protein
MFALPVRLHPCAIQSTPITEGTAMVEGTAVAADKNIDLLKRGYKAFTTGDMDTLRSEIFQPDVLWHQPGDNPTAGDYRGVEQVIALFGNLLQRTDGTFKPWLNHYAAGDGLVMGVGAARPACPREPRRRCSRCSRESCRKGWLERSAAL